MTIDTVHKLMRYWISLIVIQTIIGTTMLTIMTGIVCICFSIMYTRFV